MSIRLLRTALAALSITVVPTTSAHAATATSLPSVAPAAVLTLDAAVERALRNAPAARAALLEVRHARARALQAGAYPNPELEAEFGFLPGAPSGGGGEATLTVGWPLDFSGRRRARAGVAQAEVRVSETVEEITRADLVAAVRSAYHTAVAAEREARLTEAEIRLAEEALEASDRQSLAGATPPITHTRAEVELAQQSLLAADRRAAAEVSRRRLALLCGDSAFLTPPLADALDSLPPVPTTAALLALAERSPASRRAREERSVRARQLVLEQSLVRPSPVLKAGVRAVAEGSDRVWLAGVTTPLPLFDRNRAGVTAARVTLEAAGRLVERDSLEQWARLDEQRSALERAREHHRVLGERIVPMAERAHESIRAGFESGRFGYLELLEARRAWILTRHELLRAALAAQLAGAELDRQLGLSTISTLSSEEGKVR